MINNKYTILLENSYSHKQWAIDLINTGCDPEHYIFSNVEFPEDMPYGEYDYRLFRNAYTRWQMSWMPDINDCAIMVWNDDGGPLGTYPINKLKAESGMLTFRPESDMSPYSVMEGPSGVWIYGNSVEGETYQVSNGPANEWVYESDDND